jgi:festuclavine dehydrogenase
MIAWTIWEESRVYSAAGDGKIPWVSPEDVAGMAVHVLTVDKPPNTDFIITGPELLSFDDVSSDVFVLRSF